MKKNKPIDELMNWYFDEEDDVLKLAKMSVITFMLMLGLLTMPVWILPYLFYKKVSER